MKKIFIPLLLAQLLLAPVFAHSQVTAEEYSFAQKCHDNVNIEKKQLSAPIALECVEKLTDNNGAFLARLRNQSPAMAEATVDILAFNSALIDLKNIVTKNDGRDMALHLARVLEKNPCTLCSMSLGPKPEKTFGWVGKEAEARLFEVKKSVRTWESLGDIRTRALSSLEYNQNQERWNAQPVMKRYDTLGDWAAVETDKLVAAYSNSSFSASLKDKKPDPQVIAVLRDDLVGARRSVELAKLGRLVADLGKSEQGKPAPSAGDKKAKDLDSASKNVSGLNSKSESDQSAYLSGTFDRADSNAGGVSRTGTAAGAAKPEKFVFKELSPQQVSGLSGRLVSADAKGNLKGPFADELRGTKAGDEILAFYKDPGYAKAGTNRLDFVFTEQPKGQFGGWSPATKKLELNSELVNKWMEKNQVTPEQLFEGDPSTNPHMRKLTQNLAPTFVHEATHQRQGAKAAAAGVDYQVYAGGVRTSPYQMEMETEAFSMDNSFMAEHLQKRGASYADNLDPFDKKNTELFLKKGVEGVRLANHRTYAKLDSLEGSAAKEFTMAASTAKSLRILEEKYKAAPMTMSNDELSRMRALKATLDTRFKWYTSTRADAARAEAKINGWRDDTNNKFYPSKTLGVEEPPELL